MKKILTAALLIVFLLTPLANAQDDGSIISALDDLADRLLDLLRLGEQADEGGEPTPPAAPAAPSGNGGGGGGGGGGRGVRACISVWDCTGWTSCWLGKQTRTCTDINNCDPPPTYEKPAEEMLCEVIAAPTCNDGILNQGEEGVDCGGPCPVCETCFDEIENCHDGLCEEGVDCGGSCIPCKHVIPIILTIITAILVIILLILGFWYWKIKKTGEIATATVKEFTKRPPPAAFKKSLPPPSVYTKISPKRPPLKHF